MKLQLASRLAIYSVLELAADPDSNATAAKIGQKYDVSTHHLTRVLHILRRAGLVSATRGVGGGYRFCGNARRTTLLDVIELFETIGEEQSDDAGKEGVATEGLVLGKVLHEIDETIRATLNSITIATMLKLVDEARQGRGEIAAA